MKGEEIQKDLRAGRVAKCERCLLQLKHGKNGGMKRKRNTNGQAKRKRYDYEDSSDEEDYNIKVAGVMKVCQPLSLIVTRSIC